MRTEEKEGCAGEMLLAHLEDGKERSQLLGLLAWWRVREKTSLIACLVEGEGEDKPEEGKPVRE